MTVFDETVPPINGAVTDHACFGCGNRNPIGLGLQFRKLPDGRVWAPFTPAQEYEGYFGMAHGGIISTVLDEVMSWAITAIGEFGVTARMSVTFRQPVRIGHSFRAIGEVTSQRGRAIETGAELVEVESGAVVAEAEARFIRVSQEQADAWRDVYLSGEI